MAEGKHHALAVGVTKMSSAKMYVITEFYGCICSVLFFMGAFILLLECQDVLLSRMSLLHIPNCSLGITLEI